MSEPEFDRKELTVQASLTQLIPIWEFIETGLDAFQCPEKVRIHIRIAADEIFSNIARHSNARKGDTVTVSFHAEKEPRSVVITFMDTSSPFDPLSAAEPDLSAPAKNRKIGGLGLFMLKKIMDDVSYEYRDEKNILTIKKRL